MRSLAQWQFDRRKERWSPPIVSSFKLSDIELARIDNSPIPKDALLQVYLERIKALKGN